jgi:hypothetical protein
VSNPAVCSLPPHAIRQTAADLRAGKPLDEKQSVNVDEFEKVVELRRWQEIEKQFQP